MRGAGWKLSALKTGLSCITEAGSATDVVKIRVGFYPLFSSILTVQR